MARLARADLVDPAEVAAFHCVNRCVRRAFLCGRDPVAHRNYDHRKAWLEDRLDLLARHFGVDLLGYAIMSNHFHLVLRSRPDVVAQWNDSEVARRWMMLCPVRKREDGHPEDPTDAELDTIRNCPERLAEVRRRLSDISWLMRMTAEPIARRANQEEGCSGRFWEGRYKSVKLCDEAALLAALAYVDLNPVRAGVAATPEESDFTSVKRRVESLTGAAERGASLAPIEIEESQTGPLLSSQSARASDKGCLPITAAEYVELIDWTGRCLACGKRGAIPQDLAPILTRIGLAPTHWTLLVSNFGRFFHRVAGASRAVESQRPRRSGSGSFHPGRSDLLDAA